MNIDYKKDCHFILHQPFLQEGTSDYNAVMRTVPYQALYYEFQTGDAESCKSSISYIPNGCMDILFIIDKYGSRMELLGSSVEAKKIQRFPNARYFGIRLKPGMYLSYQDMTLRDATNQEFFFEAVDSDLEIFFQKLDRAHCLSEKIVLFHRFFDAYISEAEVNPLTGYILSEINLSQGNVRIHELADELHYSERHISRIFQDSMGITPKTFARIVRFQNVIDSILRQPMLSLCDYISELGYSDQAHFQREFKQYTGITPRKFLTFAQNNPYIECQYQNEQQAS